MPTTPIKDPSRRSLLKLSLALISTSAVGTVWTRMAQGSTSKNYTLDVKQLNGAPSYNGKITGPTITINPGENIDVHLINNLPALHDDCVEDFNNFHGLNTTNLHTHGLHVSPTTDSSGEYDADNVFVSVVPKGQVVTCETVCGADVKDTFRHHEAHYRFETSPQHPSGTFWYHAHKHGSTTRQVGAGLSGPIIIKDPAGYMPEYIEKAEEKVFMMMNRGLVLVDPEGGGTVDPTIRLRPGSVQRWRIINAKATGNDFSYFRTDIPDLEMYQIAFDGLTLPRRVKIDQYNAEEPWLNPAALAPGNRTDLMVRVPKDAKPRSFTVGIKQAMQDLINLDGIAAETNAVKLDIEISGDTVDHLWSDDNTLPGCGLVPFDDSKLATREIRFTRGNTIDGEAFTGETKQTIKLGTAEEWTITNQTQAVHAFHIHVNPLFITHINGKELAKDNPLRRWQDTIGIPFQNGGQAGSVTYKTRFEKFKGKFVIHCHVLRHEDLGMMQTVEVI